MSNDTGPARLPALPTPKTGNPSLDQWVRAVTERLEVREGARGNAAEKVVLQRDLVKTGLTRLTALDADTGGIVFKTPNGSYATMSVDAFSESIRATPLYQRLLARLDDPSRFDNLPEKVRALLLQDIADEAAKRGADIQRVEYKLQSATESLAYTMQEVTAAVANASAGVREVTYASATANTATAGQVTQVQARLDDVGGVTIEESLLATASRVSGLSGEYMVKINAGGAMAGIGLAASEDLAGNQQSAVIIQASKFALVGDAEVIADRLNPPLNRVPFGYDSATNTIYMNGQVRISAGGPTLSQATGALSITASAPQWKRDMDGNELVPSITLTANLAAPLTGLVTWQGAGYTGTVPVAGTFNTWTLYPTNQISSTAQYTATLTFGGVVHTASITLTRVQDGARGVQGDDGDTGTPGSAGSLTGYGANYGIVSTSWDPAIAGRVINNMLTGQSLATGLASVTHLMLGDTVTLSNGTNFAATRYWSGTDWLAPGVVLDGNLLVNGTVSATKITAGSIVTSGGNALINIGSTSFIGGITSPLHVVKSIANANQALITAYNDKDDSVAIWGSNAFSSGNAVSGTWHSSAAEATAGRWQMIGLLGSRPQSAAVAGLSYDPNLSGGVFKWSNGSSQTVPGATINQVLLAGSTSAVEATGAVRLMTAASPLLLNGSAGTSGQVLTSGGAGVTPTWTTVSGGGGITYSGLQSVASGTTGSALSLSTTFRATGLNAPASGAGVELAYASAIGWLISYDRSAAAYRSLNIEGSAIAFNVTPTCPTPATATNDTTIATTAFVKAQGYSTGGSGTVTSFSFTTGNGITGSVSNASTTPALSLILGAVTGTSFNGMSGIATTTPAALGTASVGTSTTGARSDHVHALQTTVSGSSGSCTGNAASATTVGGFKCVGGSGTCDASGNLTVTVSFTTASSYGASAVTTTNAYVVVTAASATSITFQAQARSTGSGVASSAIRWTAVGT